MKRKMLAVLLLVAIFAAFAGQAYAFSKGNQGVGESPLVSVKYLKIAGQCRGPDIDKLYYGYVPLPAQIAEVYADWYGYGTNAVFYYSYVDVDGNYVNTYYLGYRLSELDESRGYGRCPSYPHGGRVE